jgi:endonuclease/exonuclease/phosphatase family metal-dependent hydrolase
MRKVVLGLCGVLVWVQMGCGARSDAGQSGTSPGRGEDLRVMTFNIRLVNLKDGANGWLLRREMLYRTVEAFDPDLLGTQEVKLLQREDLKRRLTAYDTVGVGRDDGKDAGEHSLVMFKRERFEKVREGTFWLSETPEKAGSKGWDAQLPRICSWVELRDRKSGGRPIVFFNTHWDHIGKTARAESAKLMRRKVEEIAGAEKPVVITGDFNSPSGSGPYKELLGNRFVEAWGEVNRHPTTQDFTAHGFTGKNPRGERIDWILHSSPFRTKSAEINRYSENGRFPSDHFPVQAVLRWTD